MQDLKDTDAVLLLTGGIDSVAASFVLHQNGIAHTGLFIDAGFPTSRAEMCQLSKLEPLLPVRGIATVTLPALAKQVWPDHSMSESFCVSDVANASGSDEDIHSILSPADIPLRNGVFASIASAHAIHTGASIVATGINDYSEDVRRKFPDASPEFAQNLARLVAPFDLLTLHPVMHLPKERIVEVLVEAGIDLRDTWSCYNLVKGSFAQHKRYLPCGFCPPCVERAKLFASMDLPPDKYASAKRVKEALRPSLFPGEGVLEEVTKYVKEARDATHRINQR